MKKITLFVRVHWVKIILVCILLVGIFWRFYDLSDRWGLAYDQARDVIIARFALQTHQLPLLGPFSSAGAFIYGPQWFWIVMLGQLFYLPSFMTPWVWQGILCVGAVIIAFLIGKKVEDRYLGLIFALLVAISPDQIQQSVNLTSPSMAGVFSFICLYLFVLYIKYGKAVYSFLLAFFVATTINIHFQAVGLGALLPIAFLFQKKSWKNTWLLIIGFVIPFIPLIKFDLQHHFYESRNWIYYYRYGQNIAYIPTRWISYMSVFWPQLWGRVVGGYFYAGYFLIALFAVALWEPIKSRSLPKTLVTSLLAFFVIFIMLRYYKGQRFDSYFIFTQPFILLFSSWTLYQMIKIKNIIGGVIISILIIFVSYYNWTSMQHSQNLTAMQTRSIEKKLETMYPHEKFSLYSYHFANSSSALPLSLFMSTDTLLTNNGRKIGILTATTSAEFAKSVYNMNGIMIVDINSSSSAQLKKLDWYRINPEDIYHAAEGWPEDEKI